MRAVGAEQSNTSLVYDEALIFKLFRRLAEGPNPDVVVTEALARVGFTHVAEPLASWRSDEKDLGLLQRFLAGPPRAGPWPSTSLRDLYADGPGGRGGKSQTRRRRAATSAPRPHAWAR